MDACKPLEKIDLRQAFKNMAASDEDKNGFPEINCSGIVGSGGIAIPKMLQGFLLPQCEEGDTKPQSKSSTSRYIKTFWTDKSSDSPDGFIISIPTAVTKSTSSSSGSPTMSTTSTISKDSALNSIAKPNYSISNGTTECGAENKDTQEKLDSTAEKDDVEYTIESWTKSVSESMSDDEIFEIENKENDADPPKNKKNDIINDETTIILSNTSSSSEEQKQAMRCHSISKKLNCAEGPCGSGHEVEKNLSKSQSSVLNPLFNPRPWLEKNGIMDRHENTNENTNEIIGYTNVVVTGLKRSKGSRQHRVQTPKEHARENLNSKVIYSKTKINWGSTPPRRKRRAEQNLP